MLASIIDLIFPRSCAACGKPREHLCVRCAAAFPEARPHSEAWIHPLFSYAHPPLRRAIHALKYRGIRGLATRFAELLNDRIAEEIAEESAIGRMKRPLAIPVPLSAARLAERGFNQAALIARELVRFDPASREDGASAIRKIRHTASQASIKDKKKRLTNLRGCFAADPMRVRGRDIILVDDVATTGATLAEAKRALKKAGARSVIAYVIAH